ncbi:MAG: hypothetical protein ABIP49_04795 [Lysobacterales bacterium]
MSAFASLEESSNRRPGDLQMRPLLTRLVRKGAKLCAVALMGVFVFSSAYAGTGTGCINNTFPQTVQATTVDGQTRLILGYPLSALFLNIETEIQGNAISVRYVYFDACTIVPPPPRPLVIDLGVLLSPGEYTLRVRGTNAPNTYDVTRAFTVFGGAAATAVPAASPAALALLLIAFLTVGVMTLRHR